MRKAVMALMLVALGCSRIEPGVAVFTPLQYVACAPALPDGCYRNPILSGFYPDPSICRTGDDYWMVNSSFGYFPGLPVWHSTDLVHWEQCGSAITRNEDLFLGNNALVVGTFAPQISYNPGDGLYYIINTFVGGHGNFFITSADPASREWSHPVLLPDVPGIDPSLLFDDDGRAWVVSTTGLENVGETPLYPADNAIVMWEFDWNKGCTTGERHIIARHGVHPEDKPAALEGPHIYHIGDRYFLMCAEGGTELGHSEVIFAADAVTGPYEPCAINPILTQRDLPQGDAGFINCTGHADLVQSAAGQWYAVFLGNQPYEGLYCFNTGRQTCLLPVQWIDGQPVILPQGERLPTVVEMNDDLKALAAANKIKGFDTYNPGPLWNGREGLSQFALFVRNPSAGTTEDGKNPLEPFDFNEARLQGPFWSIDRRGKLSLKPKSVNIRDNGNPAAILERITATRFSAVTRMRFTPKGAGSQAGLVCFQNENCLMRFVKTMDAYGQTVMLLEEVCNGETRRLYSVPLSEREAKGALSLKVEATDPVTYEFSISVDGEHWRLIGEPLDGRSLRVPDLWGFMGAMVGVYAYANE